LCACCGHTVGIIIAWIKGYEKYSNNAGLFSAAAVMDDLPIQNIYQGFREKHSAFAKDVVGGPKEISVILRVVGLFGFVFFRSSFLCIRRRCLLHFIIFREETIFGGCRIRSEDGQTHSRASSGQLNVLD